MPEFSCYLSDPVSDRFALPANNAAQPGRYSSPRSDGINPAPVQACAKPIPFLTIRTIFSSMNRLHGYRCDTDSLCAARVFCLCRDERSCQNAHQVSGERAWCMRHRGERRCARCYRKTIAGPMRNGSRHPAACSFKQMIKMNNLLLHTTSVGTSDVLLKYSAFRPLSSRSKDL